eukprot:TRINITY_DN31163_c0_g1_i1.p1 TRINITY_DN31163_c0_g1~~TRINITY_DN31163_c0_g1_i1.p1  ORF type:complete len:443 (-),score=56.10 TRINITY_DN31163_c0_g1_i1:157-1485(-)
MDKHVLVVALPSTGHVNPLLQFAKKLCSKGIAVTLVITQEWTEKISTADIGQLQLENFSCGSSSDYQIADMNTRAQMLSENGPPSLQKLLDKLNSRGRSVSCIVYDSFLPWVVKIARDNHMPAAFFWTQSWAAFLLYHFLVLQKPEFLCELPEEIQIGGLPKFHRAEMPSVLQKDSPHVKLKEAAIEQFRDLRHAKCILGNSFEELEREETDEIRDLGYDAFSVGPLVSAGSTSAHLWKSWSYSDWLDSRLSRSVVYVAFGSIAEFTNTQTDEIAEGLLACGYPFLWVIRPYRKTGECYVPEAVQGLEKERGLVVPWCSQTEVLSHPSVGVFLSHCGWNSVLEGLLMGVPIVGFPQWSDQKMNMKCIEKKWKTGICLKTDEAEDMVKSEEVEKRVRFVMESVEGEALRKNARKWGERGVRSSKPDGSLEANVQRFVSSVQLA